MKNIKGFDLKLKLKEENYPNFQGRVWFEPLKGKQLTKSLNHQYNGCSCSQTDILRTPLALPSTTFKWFNPEFWYSLYHIDGNAYQTPKQRQTKGCTKTITNEEVKCAIEKEVSRLLNNAEVIIDKNPLYEAYVLISINGTLGFLLWENCD